MTVRLTDGEKRALAARLLRLARELRRIEPIVAVEPFDPRYLMSIARHTTIPEIDQDNRPSRQLKNALGWVSSACDRLVGAIVFNHEQEDPDAPYS